MARKKIAYKTDVVVRLEHPTDIVNAEPLDTTDDGATCSFKVFDANADEVLSADEAGAQTALSVTGVGVFKVGWLVEVDLASGAIHDFTISAVDPVAGTITGTALPSAAVAGARVRRRLGNAITMTEYGTPALGQTDWGFIGFLPKNHPGLAIGLEVDIEISFIGNVGGGLDALAVICAVVAPEADCAACS